MNQSPSHQDLRARADAPQSAPDAAPDPAPAPRIWLGQLAAFTTVTIWALWLVATRHGALGLDLNAFAVTRFLIPALVFLPILLKRGLLPRGVSKGALALMVIGAGLPYFFTSALALRLAPAAEVGPLLPGTMPLCVALIATLWERQKLGWLRGGGFVLIALGILSIAGFHLITEGQLSAGHLLAISAAWMWAFYTIAFRRTGLNPLEGAAIVAGWSAIVAVPLGAWPVYQAVQAGQGSQLFMQAMIQGLGSGAIALVLYGYGVSVLGAPRAAAFTALIPAMAAMLAIPMLGEWPDHSAIAGIVAVSIGVLLINWPRKEPAA